MTTPYTAAELAAIPDKVTLAGCPIGLFLSADGELCLKTEYGNNQGRIDAYIVSSGEFFWGDARQTIARQREQLVTPFTADVPRLVAELTRAREALRMLVAAMDRFNRTGLPIQALEAARAALGEEPADEHC